jgi:hypothetical protein
MYNIGDDGGLYASFPINFQDPETEAFCFAVENQVRKAAAMAKVMDVWGDLGQARKEHLDMIAACLGSPYYRSDMTEDQKRKTIVRSMETRRYAGGVRAIEELLNGMFENAEATPWYEYGGEPYHMRIRVTGQQSEEIKTELESILKKVKAARTIVEDITMEEIVNTYRKIRGAAVLSVLHKIELGGSHE